MVMAQCISWQPVYPSTIAKERVEAVEELLLEDSPGRAHQHQLLPSPRKGHIEPVPVPQELPNVGLSVGSHQGDEDAVGVQTLEAIDGRVAEVGRGARIIGKEAELRTVGRDDRDLRGSQPRLYQASDNLKG